MVFILVNCDDDNNMNYGSIENDTDCDGLTNEIDPDSNFADGDLDGIPYNGCDDKMAGASQYDENGNCTLAICLNENNEEVPLEGQSQTNIIYGEATITPISYEGWEQHQFTEGLQLGERNCYLDWDITGIPNVNPSGCDDCIFTFELTRTPNPFGNERVPENIDMNDGTCSFFETWQESPPPFSMAMLKITMDMDLLCSMMVEMVSILGLFPLKQSIQTKSSYSMMKQQDNFPTPFSLQKITYILHVSKSRALLHK